MKGKGHKATPVTKEAVKRVAVAETNRGGGQYGPGTLAARLDSTYQHQGGGRHAQPAPTSKKP